MKYLSVCSGIEAASVSGARGRVRDLSGHRNGRLIAVRLAHKKGGRAHWLCRCDCGGERVVQANNLTRQAGTKSCGCLRAEAQAARRKRDGVWNDGKTYATHGGGKCYRTRAAWAKAAKRHYGDQCERCGWSEASCDAHHRTPKSLGGLHTIENAIILCPNCHRVEHERGRA